MLAFWNQRNDPNILFLKYEDLKKDLTNTIYQCAEFLGVSNKLNDVVVSHHMCDPLNFDKMQRNQAVNLEPIYNPEGDDSDDKMTNGEVYSGRTNIGDWKNYVNDTRNVGTVP